LVSRPPQELLSRSNPEMLLAVGALCGVPAARTALGRAVPSVLVAACRVLDALAALVSLVQTRGISAEVDRVIAEGAARSSGADAGGGADRADAGKRDDGDEDERRLSEPEMLCFAVHGLMDFVAANAEQIDGLVADAVAGGPAAFGGPLRALLECIHRLLQNPAVHKDALTPACIILCGLVQRSSPDPTAVALQMAALAAVGPASAGSDAAGGAARALAGRCLLISACGVPGCYSIDPGSLPAFARQCLLRGALSGASPAVRAAPIGAATGGAPASLLFALVFDRVCAMCAATADLFLICYGLQVVSLPPFP